MTTHKEALTLALEALEDIRDDCSGCEFEWNNDYPLQAKAHAAIKESLAQPEQRSVSEHLEPVAWMQDTTCGLYVIDHPDEWHCIPLYTTPPQRTWVHATTWRGLTDEEVKKIAYNTAERKVAKDIEAKLKEKNDC